MAWENVVANDVLPRELPSDIDVVLSRAKMRLREVRSMIDFSIERYYRGPLDRLLRGLELSTEEFYLLRAMGVVTAIVADLGINPVDEFEAFRLLHYEDDSRICFINPSLANRRDGKVGFRFGVVTRQIVIRAQKEPAF